MTETPALDNDQWATCGACNQVVLDSDGNPRKDTAHHCRSCDKPLHSYVMCASVHVPTEGAYFCSAKCEDALDAGKNDDGLAGEVDGDGTDDNVINDSSSVSSTDEQLDAHKSNNEQLRDADDVAGGQEDKQGRKETGEGDDARPLDSVENNKTVESSVGNRGHLRDLLVPGTRIMIAFKQSDEDELGKWWGATVGISTPEERTLIAFDDGDLASEHKSTLEGIFSMGKLARLGSDVPCGLVKDVHTNCKAWNFCTLKVAKKMYTVGVLLGDGTSTLCKWELYQSHVLSEQGMASALKDYEAATSKAPAVRKSSKSPGNKDPKWGYHTFCRGDVVTWTGGGHDVVEQDNEVVYALLMGTYRSQQRRFLITYSPALNKFSVNSWSSWSRVPCPQWAKDHPEEVADVDLVASVLQAPSTVIQTMEGAWPLDPLSRTPTLDQLQKLSLLGPAAIIDKRTAEKREADRQRKEETKKRKLEEKKKEEAAAAAKREQEQKKLAEAKEAENAKAAAAARAKQIAEEAAAKSAFKDVPPPMDPASAHTTVDVSGDVEDDMPWSDVQSDPPCPKKEANNTPNPMREPQMSPGVPASEDSPHGYYTPTMPLPPKTTSYPHTPVPPPPMSYPPHMPPYMYWNPAAIHHPAAPLHSTPTAYHSITHHPTPNQCYPFHSTPFLPYPLPFWQHHIPTQPDSPELLCMKRNLLGLIGAQKGKFSSKRQMQIEEMRFDIERMEQQQREVRRW